MMSEATAALTTPPPQTATPQTSPQTTQQAAAQASPPAATPPADDAPWYMKFEGVDAELKAFLEGKNFQSPIDALKSGMHSDRVARDRNVLPKPDPAKLGEWDGWRELGLPNDVKDYKIERPKIADGVPYDESIEADFVAAAHAAKIPPSMAQGLFQSVIGKMQDRVLAQMQQDAQQAEKNKADFSAGLDAAWGSNRAVKEEQARAAVRHFGLSEQALSTLEAQTGSAELMQFFAKLGEGLSEDSMRDGGRGAPVAMGPAAAQAEINRLTADVDFRKSLRDRGHPLHAQNKARWDQLNASVARG